MVTTSEGESFSAAVTKQGYENSGASGNALQYLGIDSTAQCTCIQYCSPDMFTLQLAIWPAPGILGRFILQAIFSHRRSLPSIVKVVRELVSSALGM